MQRLRTGAWRHQRSIENRILNGQNTVMQELEHQAGSQAGGLRRIVLNVLSWAAGVALILLIAILLAVFLLPAYIGAS